MDTELVWARDANEGFIECRITEMNANQFEVTPTNTKYQVRNCAIDDVFAACSIPQDVNDCCELLVLNEATFLENLKLRYFKDKIYTYVANILIAVNPYCDLHDFYSNAKIKEYKDHSLGKLPPHVFAIADKVLRDMRVLRLSQSIMVSGESGAGKTETTKYLLKYLCESQTGVDKTVPANIEQKILAANPVLEAFGNAKTTRNNNSSRFGKFIELHYNAQYELVGGFISHYLLEKSRVCRQNAEERNYHIFHMLLAGAAQELLDQLHLSKPEDYSYLGKMPNVCLDDEKLFQQLDASLEQLDLKQQQKFAIYTLVAAVLHLGNIHFEDNPLDMRGGCKVTESAEKYLQIVSSLLQLDLDALRQSLTTRVVQSRGGGSKGTVILVPLKVYEANNARDALAKNIYSRLFDHVVNVINQSIPFAASEFYIGILDIAGFEYLTVNSFEQFCINYCNEKLQKFFNDNILKKEQELYKLEGLNVPEVSFADNQDVIDLLECKTKGVFVLLDEESKLPKPSATHFTSTLHQTWQNNFRFTFPRRSHLKAHRALLDEDGFLVRHFAGAVCYNTAEFIEKNNDALHASLESLLQESSNDLLKQIFANNKTEMAVPGKLSFVSVGSKFKTQLAELMQKLQANGTHFIRCIKPNNKMCAHDFEGGLALAQLKCSGTISVLQLMEYGYPSRVPFTDLYELYKSHLPAEMLQMPARVFCETMLKSLRLSDKDYRFGVSKVFFRPDKFAEFDHIMKTEGSNRQEIIERIKTWMLQSQLQRFLCKTIRLRNFGRIICYRRKCAIILQAAVRGFLARRQHKPRYKGIQKVKKLHQNAQHTMQIAESIADEELKQQSIKKVHLIHSQINSAIAKILTKPSFGAAEIESMYDDLIMHMNGVTEELNSVLQQAKEAEKLRLQQIQEMLLAETLARNEQKQQKQQEEEMRKQKAELEVQRKEEEAAHLAMLAEQSTETAAEQMNAILAAAEQKQHEQLLLEQRRQDELLALSLANGNKEQLADDEPAEVAVTNPDQHKFDLSSWKYCDLREAINNSKNVELLEACRREFHRRLKVYHAWRAKNGKRAEITENKSAPNCIIEAASKATTFAQPRKQLNTAQHRYFCIPIRTVDAPYKCGAWYAHFDGQWLVRQMELHPEKTPILFQAGIDDLQMCQLCLDETGLTRKRGAEILEQEFNREWQRHGGKPYEN